jgi:imidazolonepropionase-like amidohydrolase
VRIDHVTIVSAERDQPLPDASVFVHDGRIAEIVSGPNAELSEQAKAARTQLDAQGLYLTPGFIDSHVHLGLVAGMMPAQEQKFGAIGRAARKQVPRSYLQFGFTTLVDLTSTPELMAKWQKEPLRPDTYFCGAAPVLDGYPMHHLPKAERALMFPHWLAQSQQDAEHTPEAIVARMHKEGARCVKLFFERGFGADRNLPVPTLANARAVVAAAHAVGMKVILHANSFEAHTFALDAGVDVIAHGLWHWPGSDAGLTPEIKSLLDREQQAQIGVQPTMQVLYGEIDLFNPDYLKDPQLKSVLPGGLIDWYASKPGQWYHDELLHELFPSGPPDDPAQQRLRIVRSVYTLPLARERAATGYLVQHGARLLFGTDTPSAPTYANPPGLNGLQEIARLKKAGATPAQLFESMTLNNAQAFGLQDTLGSVVVGQRANLLLLRADPMQKFEAYTAIDKVIIGGRVVAPAELHPAP